MIDLGGLISTILGFGTSIAKDKLQRHELVIKLLKQLKLDPEHPPADFTAVYQYALVEYGIGKPKPVLEIFRQSEIQQIFRRALDQNNPAILLKEGEEFLAGHVLGDELHALGLSARREFYEFAAVFIEIAKRTRTPAEVLTNQRLESLHRQIGMMQERLNRLPTLEGIRTEMARLAEQDLLVLPAAEANTVKQCRAFALAQQMRGWFETLGYRFEKYEVWEDDYFEWVINVPVRRNRFDRILVRGIEGEAGLGDVMALRQAVETQTADEGWLVTARRISRAARDEVEKPENRHLDCYTFDELVDLDADFSGYIEWLEAEIQQRGIETTYVPIACTKEELDPVTKQRLTVSRYDERDGWIDGYIDRWLDDSAKEHISVLGEFGTGKTWFAFHYAWVALKRYQEAKERGTQRPRLPLVITLRDYAKALNVENVLAGFFFTQHNIRLNSEVFDQLNRMGKLLLIFDGFDEMAAKVDKQQMINNFWELAKVVVPGAKVILTCRTEHFPEAQDGRALLNAELQASTANLTGETPQFEVLELEKFTDEQIRQVLSFQATPATVAQVMGNPQLLDLARRPVMTALILEALPDIEAGKPVDMSRVYLYAVRRKMERDIKAERTFTSLADKLYFLCELSWEMLSTDQMSLNYRLFPDRIRKLFGAMVQEEKDLDHWHYDMMGQTMLIRNADGDYAPAHRSLLEFFVAYKFAAELGALHEDFLGIAQEQGNINPTLEGKVYTWSEFFQRNQNPNRIHRPNSPLKNFSPESFSNLKKTFGLQVLSPAVLELLQKMIVAENVWSILDTNELATVENIEDTHYIGGNCLTLLSAANENLEGQNFSGLNLKGASFSAINLNDTDFSSSNLTEASFSHASLENTNFSSANLLNISFEEDSNALLFIPFEGSEFFICIKNNWIYQNSTKNDIKVRKLIFVGKGTWQLYSVEKKGFFLLQKNSNLLKFWLFEQNNFTWIKKFDGSPIKDIAYAESSNTLLLLRANNNIESWSFYPLELQASFHIHNNVYGIGYLKSKNILVTVEKDSMDETVKVWQTQDKNTKLTLLHTLKKSKYENINITENHIIFLTKDALHEKSLQIKIYGLVDNQHICTYNMEYESNIWCLNSDQSIFCFINGEEIIVKNYLLDKVIISVASEEGFKEVRSINLLSSKNENNFILVVDYSNFTKLFYIDRYAEKTVYIHNLPKESDDSMHSIYYDFKNETIIAGSNNGKVYAWGCQDGSLVFKLSLCFEYSGMRIENARNLDPSILAWLKQRGVQGIPIMDDVMKVKAGLKLMLGKDISDKAKNHFITLKSLVSQRFNAENPLSPYLDLLESSDSNISVRRQRRHEILLDDFVEDIDWTDYPEIIRYFGMILEDF